MDGLSRLLKDYCEDRDGRIRWWNHLYLFLDAAGRRRRVRNWKNEPWEERTDAATGRLFSFFRGRGAQCFHPDLWKGVFPYWLQEGRRAYVIVPAKECKTCQFHEPAKPYGRKRYASCRWFRDNSGMEHPFRLAVNAVSQAKEMLK